MANVTTLSNIEGHKSHLRLLDIYKLDSLRYVAEELKQNNVNTSKHNIDEEITTIDKKINDLQTNLAVEQTIFKQCTQLKNKYNKILDKQKLYTNYCKTMHFNGFPYEILKIALPEIESRINEFLRNIVEFSVKIIDDTQIINKKTQSTIGEIDINICYPKQKPRNVELSSGFEKFIISLAVRIVLCNISKTNKPDLLIIDEGWSCLDANNLSNIKNTMDYIKQQFEHVIIISHLEQLQNQAQYIINIEKKNGHSYVNTNGNTKNINQPEIVEV